MRLKLPRYFYFGRNFSTTLLFSSLGNAFPMVFAVMRASFGYVLASQSDKDLASAIFDIASF